MKSKRFVAFLAVACVVVQMASAQGLGNGDAIYRARNVHAGNLVRATFHNNGRMGSLKGDQTLAYTGEWPIGSGKVQMGNTSAYVMSELRVFSGLNPSTRESTYTFITPAVFCEGWDPNVFSHDTLGRFQGFEPLPGFLNLTQKEKDPQHAIAMSHQAFTWPPSWPDRTADAIDPGWGAHWNGYFGKDQRNADQESYFVLDDYQFDKKLKGLQLPLPIATDLRRGGLGLRMSVRGLQWSNPDAEDCIFWLYDIRNFGEEFLDRTLFGINVGASSGGLLGQSGDYDDDAARFYREKGLAVNYDTDNRGIGGYSPVPWVGFAFLESPGNAFDGIDNDGDGGDPARPGGGTGRIININDDFARIYPVGAKIVTIDYRSERYDRTVTTMPAQGISFTLNGQTYKMPPSVPLIEIPRNGIDDNLNGLIDESDGSETQDSVKYFLYIKSQYNNQDYLAKDYITGSGLSNLMIDERRDDGLDNDGDWNPQFDDVGMDGKPGTGDEGEGDGKPTAGRGDLPGEPNIDVTDVDESDQIGLTSFKFYRYGSLLYSNDDQMWNFSNPGYFDNKTTEIADYDYVFSSGFFPLRPSQKEFFSITLIYGWDETDILRNKDIVQKIYNANYNFAIAPTKPVVTAVAGDKQVTLYWDEEAEKSFDRYLRVYDFEGYKIYKATHYTLEDAGYITDGLGYERFKKPLAIYDRIDSVYGYFPKDFGTGVLFNLGSETGLAHSFVDRDVSNGLRYYYAVTAFDRGDLTKNIGPSECAIYVNVDQSGNIQYGENVVAVVPQAPSAGYQNAGFDVMPAMVGEGLTRGQVGVNILEPAAMKDAGEYEIQFLDQTMDKRDNDLNGLVDGADRNELLPTQTTGFVLRHTSGPASGDTTWVYDLRKDTTGKVVEIENLYKDSDGDPRTFRKVTQGLEIVVRSADPGVYHDSTKGIVQGIRLGKNQDSKKGYDLQFGLFKLGGFRSGTGYPRQYKLVFSNSIVDTSERVGLPLATTNATYPVFPSPVNFKAYDMQTGLPLRFGFVDKTVDEAVTPVGHYSAGDRIIFYEKLANDSVVVTWSVLNDDDEDTTYVKGNNRIMGAGDTLYLYTDGPYTGNVLYRFKVKGESINRDEAAGGLSAIRVVPNPYVVSAVWEPRNPYTSGRGPRSVQFIHLPQQCTIRIFAIDGTLVRTLDHNSSMANGAETWDLLSKESMDVSFGVYVYHVDAPGIGEQMGKIFIIK
jgi:hypothetical protein